MKITSLSALKKNFVAASKQDASLESQRKTAVKQALQAYNVRQWGEGYFSINDAGHITVCLDGQTFSLSAISAQLAVQEISLPVVVRFPQIIRDRVNRLYQAFRWALEHCEYKNTYTLVYPIKVNQQQGVVDEVLTSQQLQGQPSLEVGTKAELMIALSVSPKNTLIICNGYKDAEYVRLVLLAQQLGHCIYMVIEKPAEVSLILDIAQEVGLMPLLGVRVQLASQAKSAWGMTSGEKAKFGLNASQLLQVIERLRAEKVLDKLELLHVHFGSQLVNLDDIEQALQECCRFYVELHKLGALINTVDLGGGLAIDYEGTHSTSTYSMNYTLETYAHTLVRTLKLACEAAQLPEPALMTESGRALVAHHAVLLANVCEVDHAVSQNIKPPQFTDPDLLHVLWKLYKTLPLVFNALRAQDVIVQLKEHMSALHKAYRQGEITLAQRAWSEHLCELVYQRLGQGYKKSADDDVSQQLSRKLASQCHVNFSLFQSLPDAWGINQVFPVLPLVGLDQPLTQRAVISDMTCDSEGSLLQYVTEKTVKNTLLLPAWSNFFPKILAFFLVGAYQEGLGSRHNLLGAVSVIEVTLDKEGELSLYDNNQGDCIADMLHSINFHYEKIMDGVLQKLETSVLPKQQQTILYQQFQKSLYGYTYLQGS